MTQVIVCCEHMLKELRDAQCHSVPFKDLSIHDLWRYCGAASWDEIQQKFR